MSRLASPQQTPALTVSAQNTFTSAIVDAAQLEKVAISITSLSFLGTVTLQRRLDNTNWRDVKTYTDSAEETYEVDTRCDLRLGVKTGDYTSGSVELLLKKG